MVRRARPLLGTYVEIEAHGFAASGLETAVNAAFDAVAKVHRLMSFHESGSDISRLNRGARHEPVAVHPWTAAVLRRAQTIFAATDGLFDCAVGYELVQAGALPAHGPAHISPGTFAAVELLAGHKVRLTANIAIDLGGIAKGFAVDRAIATLRALGVREAVVNAGGDMRVMGRRPHPIFIRCPNAGGRLVKAGLLQNGAVATSSAAATVSRPAAAAASDRGTCPCDPRAYSVVAPTCAVADALTKVLVQVGDAEALCFARFGATAFIVAVDAMSERAA